MRKSTKFLSLVIALAMLLSLGAFASGEASGEASGGASGSGGIDLTGMLALKQYVFVASQGEIDGNAVSTDLYGVYAPGDEGEAAFVPEAFAGDIAVFTDSACTAPATGVTAAAANGVLTLTGVDAAANTAYYLSTGDDAYATTIYVVGNEYAENTATLTLADGTSVELTTYAPNMAYGDYTAITDANPIEGDTATFIGGNRTAVTLDDLTDTENFAGHEDAVAWYLRSGITNAGDGLTVFGDKLYGYEYAVGMYRLFQIVVDQITAAAGFVDPDDFVGAMFSNDPYSDAVSATVQAGIWDGVYTRFSDVKDLGEGFYLTENIDGVTSLGTGAVVDVEFAYVGMFNAFTSIWTMLNEDGVAMAAALEAAAAAFDGASAEPSGEPSGYSNEAKIAAVSSVLLGEETVPAADTQLTKAEAVEVLYAAKDYVQGKIAPDASRAEATGSEYADMSRFFGPEYGDTLIVTPENLAEVQATIDEADLISEENAALLINNAGELTITNNTVSLTGNADKAVNDITGLSDPRYALDGQEAATDPTHDGFVYNATSRNAFYRFAVGTAMGVWGKDTIVNLRSDNGTLVIDGEASGSTSMAGTMAGTAYVGFGGSLNITNAVAYSSSQHLTNNLYNGTVHYVDSAAFGSGRVFSSDFWGGYQVFEDSIATGGAVIDEPTTLIVKNSVYANTIGGNGYASNYFENSILNVSTATFQNMTSLTTDAGALTLVNSVVNNGGTKLFAANGCERAIITVVDSELNLAGSILASVGNRSGVNAITDVTVDPANLAEYQALYDGEMLIRFYGDVTINAEGSLTVDVAEGGELTICSANLTAADITNTGAGTLNIVTDPAYGTVTVQ